MAKDKTRIIFITLLTLISAYVFAPIPNKPLGDTLLRNIKINPGIDLAGGAEVIYTIYDPDNPGKPIPKDDAQQVVTIIRKRIDRTGLKEPIINLQGSNRVQVQVAGIDKNDWKEYKSIVESTGVLEWKEVVDPEKYEDLYKLIQEDPGSVPKDMQRVENPSFGSGNEPEDKYKYMLLIKDPIVTGKEVKSAFSSYGGLGKGYSVDFVLGGTAVRKFAEATSRLAGKGKIAILLDGKIKSKPNVNSAITGGRGEITGNFSKKEAEETALFLTTGSLPFMIGRYDVEAKKYIPKVPEMEMIVGPTLGQDAIKLGIIAIIASMIVVSLFMIIYYKVFGLISVFMLILNLLFLMTILSLLGATFTLPGIAGLVLVVGTAVDASILIYERMKEEREKNKTIIQSFEHGYNKALSAITDANVTTLLAAMILYFFGTGPIKGFASTLFIGVLTTLFTVLYCGKTFVKLYIYGKSSYQLLFLNFFRDPKFNFMKYARTGLIVSIILTVAAIGFIFQSGGKALGFDFTGGSVLTFQFTEPVEISEVRKQIQDIKGENGLPKYPDAQIQIVADPHEGLSDVASLATTKSRRFQLRTGFLKKDELKGDIIDVFKGILPPIPIQELDISKLQEEQKYIFDKKVGYGVTLNFNKDGLDPDKVRELIISKMRNILSLNNNIEPVEPYVSIIPGVATTSYIPVNVLITEEDAEKEDGAIKRAFKQELGQLYANKRFNLIENPFLLENNIGPVVAEELQNSTFWALLISWIVIIIYLWIRFFSAKLGFAAVIALIHDGLLSIAFVVLVNVLIPKSLGINFDISLATVAAILTIIGYSVNDTIVIFDRIRENLKLLRKLSYADIINMSINQTLARTVNTSLTTWLAVICLFIITMKASGGISALTLPLIFGIIVGTYSTLFVANPLIYLFNKGKRPDLR